MNRSIRFFIIFTVTVLTAQLTYAYELPKENCRAKYFYIFGPDGNPLYGAREDFQQDLYIYMPKDETRNLSIYIYDPDTGDFRDLRESPENPWDTVIEFAVYGKADKELAKEDFSQEKEYDRSYYELGTFEKEEGEPVGDFYRFKFTARGIVGDDANLYKVAIYPYSAEAFTYDISLRLVEKKGEKMYLYPEVPAGETQITVENYDIDPTGGTSELYDHYSGLRYFINDSASGQWAETVIDLEDREPRRLEYVITKDTQKYGHACVRIRDKNGMLLPIHFRKGRALFAAPKPVTAKPAPLPQKPIPEPKAGLSCNEFTFDATESYDPDNQNLSFRWDFGDGEASEEPVVTHTYAKAGEYTVALTVKDDSGLICDTAVTKQVVKVNMPPKPAFKAEEKACVGTGVVFDASATKDDPQDTLTYKWDFGDGTTAEGMQATKKYTKGKTYTVILTVDDNNKTVCSVAKVQKTIRINTQPVADAGDDIQMWLATDEDYVVTFDARKSRDPDGDALSYLWDFGDGETSDELLTTHTYKKGGVYTVKLAVDDGSGLPCSSDTDTITVRLNKQPVAVIAAEGEEVKYCVGTDMVLDGSKSYDPDGDELVYTWDFGDGTTAEGKQLTHRYQKGGKYLVTLTVDDQKDTTYSKARDTIWVLSNSKPIAYLEPLSMVCVGAKVDFDASGSSDPDGDRLKYIWDFGDGVTLEDGSKTSHIYEKGGNYTVKVSVDDQRGTDCSSSWVSQPLAVNTPPVAKTGPNLVCCIDTESIFDGSGSSDADGDPLIYKWDFGDGGIAQGEKVTHVYTKGGTYTVTLEVDDNSGTACSTSTSSFNVTVNDRPVAIIKIR